ncbi:MAG: zinc ABC transporter substrate-binding protein [Kiritimatiellae bacterium]|nr:zinc ABC transporter substrate-binding protein [Kiritimatiellia bacterium]
MKHLPAFLLAIALPLTAAAAPLRIVATTFPAWDWARQIAPDADATLLHRPGADLHGYEPTAADLKAIAGCDLFIHTGGESDAWVPAALAVDGNPGRRVVSLIAALGGKAKTERLEEGMEAEEEEDSPAPDEHVWLSLRNAQILVRAIADAIAAADPDAADACRARAERYASSLAALDAEYTDAFARAPRRTLLFADRFPFRYLADDYNLECIAAFPGCSSESAASFRTIATLARKVDDLGLTTIFTLEAPSGHLAETVRDATRDRDQRIVALDSMQTLPSGWQDRSCFDIMGGNLRTIHQSLTD